MNLPVCSVVAIAAADAVRRSLVCVLSQAQLQLASMPCDGRHVLPELMQHRPDLLVLDLQLPGMDGAQAAHTVLQEISLPLRPRILLLREAGQVVCRQEELEAMGVVLLEKPFSQDAFETALRRAETSPPRFLPAQLQRIERLLDELGVPAHPGRECLKHAALYASIDFRVFGSLRSMLYVQVGEICGMQPQQAERAMRHAINAAWRSDKFENQYRIFADTVDAGRGEPTLSEMIARLADILRLEG